MLGVLSDSHGNTAALASAVGLLSARGVSTVVHCGDVDTPEAVDALERLEVHWVLGNCDVDIAALEQRMRVHGHVPHGLGGEIVVGDRRVVFTHGHRPGLMRALLATRPDYLLHGHTHEPRDERVDGVRVLNPGALYRARPRTILLLDPARDHAEWIEVSRDP